MPTIEITPEQAASLARGESITLAPPKPEIKYNCSFIPYGSTRHQWHSRDDLAPRDNPRLAAQRFMDTLRGADSAGGGLVAVCPRDVAPGAYLLKTIDTSYFRVENFQVQEGGI